MTAARNYVLFNPVLHLAGYYRNLLKCGMKKTDVRKRVARALVRVFFRVLYSLVGSYNSEKIEKEEIGRESDMANGPSRSDKDHSNISFSSPTNNNTEGVEKNKVEENQDSGNNRLLEKIPVS